jgi:hypothetical protein
LECVDSPYWGTNTDVADTSSRNDLMQMELRYNEVERARNIYERYVRCLPTVKAWVRYAKFEMKNGEIPLARGCYERAIEELGEDGQTVGHPLDLNHRPCPSPCLPLCLMSPVPCLMCMCVDVCVGASMHVHAFWVIGDLGAG